MKSFLCLFAFAVVLKVQGGDLRQELEDAAGKLRFFATDAVVGNTFDEKFAFGYYPYRGYDAKRDFALLAHLSAARFSVDEAERLLTHEDPKVRTLALMILYAADAPTALPKIMSLAGDTAMTFPRLKIQVGLAGGQTLEAKGEPQTVGWVARSFAGFYWHATDCSLKSYSPDEFNTKAEKAFAGYWGARKDRSFCASWLYVRWLRSGNDPNGINECQRQLAQLTPEDRAWTLLWLNARGEFYNRPPAGWPITESETVHLISNLGREKFLKLLRLDFDSADPDVCGVNDVGRRRMVEFVLNHAGDFLRPEDWQAVLDDEAFNLSRRDGVESACWAIAAATLNPSHASEIMRGAFDRYRASQHISVRTRLSVGLVRLTGEKDIDFVVSRFYAEPLYQDTLPEGWRVTFVSGLTYSLTLDLTREMRRPARLLVGHIIQDSKFERLDWPSLASMVHLVNELRSEPVIPDREVSQVSYQNGHHLVIADEMDQTDSDEMRALRQAVQRWRAKLREVSPELLRPEGKP